MCGFVCAFTRSPGNMPGAECLDRMEETIRHRGPDDRGSVTTSNFVARHCRLSIIDIQGGKQPMYDSGGEVCLIFNGEIYNFKDLASTLRLAGRPVRGTSDSEVLLEAYLHWGEDCLDRLDGMFAFAIYDQREGAKLFVARDRFGEKPLYLYDDGRVVMASSELKGLLASGRVPKRLNPAALYSFLTLGYVAGARCMIEGVMRLEPGHAMVFEEWGAVRHVQYWSMPAQRDEVRGEAFVLGRVRDLLSDSVQLRMQADVPLGFLLSGGVDSSSMVALASGATTERLRTFTIGFRDGRYDERPHARFVAKRFGTIHHELVVEPASLELVDEVAWFADEPLADDSLIPMWLISRLASSEVKVALSGDGGDELFAGYEAFRGHFVSEGARLVPQPVRRSLAHLLRRLPGNHSARRLKHLRRARNLDDVDLPARERIASKNQTLLRRADLAACSETLRSQCTVEHDHELFGALFDPSTPPIAGFVRWQQTTDLVDHLLMKTDRMSMAHGLEVRAPFLDARLAEFLSRVPVRLKLSRLRTKYVLRRAMETYLPAAFLWRRKQGFNAPLAMWFKDDLLSHAADRILAPGSLCTQLLERESLLRLVGEQAGLRQDRSRLLWGLLMLDAWARAFGIPADALEHAAEPSVWAPAT